MSPVWLRASARNDPGSLAPLACPPATTTIKQRGRRLNCRSVTPASLVGSSSVPLVWRNAAPVPPPRRAQADARTIPPASGVSPSAFALTSTDSAARAEPAPTSDSPATASTATTASDHGSPPQKRRVTPKKSAIARILPPPADASPRANLPHRPSAISPAPSANRAPTRDAVAAAFRRPLLVAPTALRSPETAASLAAAKQADALAPGRGAGVRHEIGGSLLGAGVRHGVCCRWRSSLPGARPSTG